MVSAAGGIAETARVRRRYLRVGGQNLFYLSAGSGPPLLLIHSSPGDSAFFQRDIPVLSTRYSVFAFDTPGFGRSDPLPLAQRDVAFLADKLADAIRLLGLPPVLVYGSHTGAAIAAEVAARQPEVVRALMLDGFPMFNQEELKAWFGDFMPTLVPDKQGGHFASVWTRVRDQSVWFPWSYKKPDHLLNQGVAPVTRIQATMMSMMRCGRTYLPAFRSALFYGPRAPATLARIRQPTAIVCAKGDPLSAHLARLPRLKATQSVHLLATGQEVKALRDEWLAQHAGEAAAPPRPNRPSPEHAISLYNAELSGDREVFLRVAGDPAKPALLLIHDAPGSSFMHAPLIAALAQHSRVYAVDLPGCGESDPLPGEAPAIGDFVDIVRSVIADLGVGSADFLGIGIGGAVALAVADREPSLVRRLLLQSLPLPGADERQDFLQNYAPRIELKPDGSHWYATWLMLRDSLAFWPWYRSSADRYLRRVDLSDRFDADQLHDWTVEVMKQFASYHHVINAVFGQEAAPMLARCRSSVVFCADSLHPFSVYETAARAIRPDAARIECPGSPVEYAARIANAIGG